MNEQNLSPRGASCRCGCGFPTRISNGYVKGHRPVIGAGTDAKTIRRTDTNRARKLITYLGKYSTSQGRILAKTYDAGSNNTVFIIKGEDSFEPSPTTYEIWMIDAHGICFRATGRINGKIFRDLKSAHAAALDYAEYSVCLRAALERLKERASLEQLAEVAASAHYAVACSPDSDVSFYQSPQYVASLADLMRAIKVAYPDEDATAVRNEWMGSGESVADTVEWLRQERALAAREAEREAAEVLAESMAEALADGHPSPLREALDLANAVDNDGPYLDGRGWTVVPTTEAADVVAARHARDDFRKGDRFTFAKTTGYRLHQERPFGCRDAYKCVCGRTCDGVTTHSTEVITEVIHYVSGGIEIKGHLGSRREVRPDRLD